MITSLLVCKVNTIIIINISTTITPTKAELCRNKGHLQYKMCSKDLIQHNPSILTSIEGKELGELKQLWKEIATSEARLALMSDLRSKKLGFNEIESFSLGLQYDFKSNKWKENGRKKIEKVIETAMTIKIQDEAQHHRELCRKREKRKKWLEAEFKHKKYQYKKLINQLRKEAEKTKKDQKSKYDKKTQHIEAKTKQEDTEEEHIPKGMEKLIGIKIFRKEAFDEIKMIDTEVPIIGEVELSEAEKNILRRTPKFAIPETLEEHSLKEDMEKAFCKLRMELRDEEVNEDDNKLDAPILKSKEEEEREEKEAQEYDAKSRQIYDPINKIYDDRKRRVTDLVECNRVTLPRPLNIIREAQIESRREIYNKIYQRYRREACNHKGEQESGLRREEKKGLERLKERIRKEELVIMKTDKSGKFSVTTRETYKEMGEEHVGKDHKIDRKKVKELDKTMNEHSRAWCGIWKTGADHNQEDRVLASKCSKSENTAKLYLSYKDHKAEARKTRPIGTANTSNTRGFANSVSDLLEAVANSEENPYEVISSEDMLHHVGTHNLTVEKNKEQRKKKLKCDGCKTWSRKCKEHSLLSPPSPPLLPNHLTLQHTAEETLTISGPPSPPPTPTNKYPTDKEQGSNIYPTEEADLNEEVSYKALGEGGDNYEKSALDAEKPALRESSEIIREILENLSCEECAEERKNMIRKDCKDCGEGVEENWILVGMDAVALFPSMTAATTGKIIKKKVEKTKMSVEGFNWKKASLYIKTNLVNIKSKISKETRQCLPIRKSKQGTTPGMASEGFHLKKDSEDKQWIFRKMKPTEKIQKEMMGLACEVAINVLWNNYCYTFGGELRLQSEGGPIGQRPTMAASRLVMSDYMEKYENILMKSDLKISMLKVYVDDGRQITSKLKKGMRYDNEEEKFVWNEIAEKEDDRKELEGEKEDEFMARVCLEAMNQINPDLTFTAEVQSDFVDKKLPTLDFTLEMQATGNVKHSYFEKAMKNQILIEKDSAMSIKQKYCILSNEVTRRLYNVAEDEKEEEVEKVLDKMTEQLKNSGWNQNESREIIVSGYKGWKNRLERRKEESGQVYRSAASSLSSRSRKKLTGKVDWYKESRKRKRDEEDYSKSGKKIKIKKEENLDEVRIASVMFVPFTVGGELLRRLKEAENEMAKQTGIKIKMVEKVGVKLVDILHKSDPWQGMDCGRTKCLLCKTKSETEKNVRQDCTQRNIVYETWCRNCEENEIKRISEEEIDEKEKIEKKKKIILFKYIGETARSAYERGLEHLRDYEDLKADSHMLKHFLDKHEDEIMEEVVFGMKVIKTARSAFERQVAESVMIQSNKMDHHILNSKAEYNRCALPRLTAKIGNYTIDELEKEKEKEREEEKKVLQKIRNLKVNRSKIRREINTNLTMPAQKKRKTGHKEYKRVIEVKDNSEKRKGMKEKPENFEDKRMKTENAPENKIPEQDPKTKKSETKNKNDKMAEAEAQAKVDWEENKIPEQDSKTKKI